MMRVTCVVVGGVGLAQLALGCGTVCTSELRSAVIVHVSSPAGLEVDAVTVVNHGNEPCHAEPPGNTDAGTGAYVCWEAGGGQYVVQVKSGGYSWTQQASVSSDDCHVTSTEELHFELLPETADS